MSNQTDNEKTVTILTNAAGWGVPENVGGNDWAAWRATPYGKSASGTDLTVGVLWTAGGTATVVIDNGQGCTSIEGDFRDVERAVRAAVMLDDSQRIIHTERAALRAADRAVYADRTDR